jgi:sulfane dehydrogenase subunit SoxC
MNGEALRPEQGYPLRAVDPGWKAILGEMAARIEAGDQPWQTREETSKYTDCWPTRSRKHTSSWMRNRW